MYASALLCTQAIAYTVCNNNWNCIVHTNTITDEQLRHYIKISKMQVPTVRNQGGSNHPAETTEDTVKELEDGTVSVTEIEIKPSSSGRERFGKGTKDWEKYGKEERVLSDFCL